MILSVNIKKAKQYETMNYFIIHLSTQGLNLLSFCALRAIHIAVLYHQLTEMKNIYK